MCSTAGLYLDSVPKGKLRTAAFGWVLENSELITKTMQFPVKQGPLGIHRRPVVGVLLAKILPVFPCDYVCNSKSQSFREEHSTKLVRLKLRGGSAITQFILGVFCCISETKGGERKLQIPKPALSLQCAD